jgi:hypothetical protein
MGWKIGHAPGAAVLVAIFAAEGDELLVDTVCVRAFDLSELVVAETNGLLCPVA